MTRRTFWIILIVGAALRLLLIWQAELWYDENFTLVLSRLPFTQMLLATMGDVHPPLYFIIVWPLGHIANLAPWALRLPSALFSIISLALYPRLMRGLHVPGNVQLVAFVFMALLPMQLHYAQEARMYALLECLAVIGAIAVLEGRAVTLGLSVAGLLYTQNYGAFYVAALGVALAFRYAHMWEVHRKLDMGARAVVSGFPTTEREITDIVLCLSARARNRKWLRVAIGLAIGVAAWLPWLPVVLRQGDFIKDNYWIFDTSPGATGYEIYKLFFALSLSNAAGHMAGILLVSALVIMAAWHLLSHRPPHAWRIITALAFGPILLALVASLVYQPMLLYRPLIGVTPFLYLACAYPLGAITSLRGRLYIACFIGPVMVLGLLGYFHFNPEQKTTQGTGSMQAAVAYVVPHWQPGDVILHGSGLGWISMEPYLNAPQYAIPNCTPKFPGSISLSTRDAIGIPAGDIGQLPPHRRVWFTAVFSPMLPACQADHTEQIIAGRAPTLVLSETKFLLSAIWLLEE